MATSKLRAVTQKTMHNCRNQITSQCHYSLKFGRTSYTLAHRQEKPITQCIHPKLHFDTFQFVSNYTNTFTLKVVHKLPAHPVPYTAELFFSTLKLARYFSITSWNSKLNRLDGELTSYKAL
jgi:hypothetical protein